MCSPAAFSMPLPGKIPTGAEKTEPSLTPRARICYLEFFSKAAQDFLKNFYFFLQHAKERNRSEITQIAAMQIQTQATHPSTPHPLLTRKRGKKYLTFVKEGRKKTCTSNRIPRCGAGRQEDGKKSARWKGFVKGYSKNRNNTISSKDCVFCFLFLSL